MSKNELRQQRGAPQERFCEWRGPVCPAQPRFFFILCLISLIFSAPFIWIFSFSSSIINQLFLETYYPTMKYNKRRNRTCL